MQALLIRVMATLVFVAATGCFCATANGQDTTAQGPKPSFSLTISPGNETVEAGSPVLIKVTMENQADHAISVWRENSEDQGGFTYKAEIWDEKGSRAHETRFGRVMQGHETIEEHRRDRAVVTFSGGFLSLDPGKVITDQVDARKLYDFSRPGKYAVQLYRFDSETKTNVMSNKITVKIIPRSER